MTKKTIKTLLNEFYSKPPKKIYATNRTDVYHIDDIWSLDTLDLKEYGPENNRRYRYVLVILDNFSKFGCTTPLKNENAQTMKLTFEIFLITSKRKPNLFETDFHNNIFQDLLNKNNIKFFLEKLL